MKAAKGRYFKYALLRCNDLVNMQRCCAGVQIMSGGIYKNKVREVV